MRKTHPVQAKARGAANTVEVPKYLFSAPHLFCRITDLARSLQDGQIAEVLNAEGL